jgi:2-polyprenyl-6-methoxyphenol hydroxylase-like FAD-dependent oxidoreductase
MSNTTTTIGSSCVIAGGGPAGAMLGLLLARGGVEVTLLEKHADFLRDFRGDTIHPSTLRILDELGLAEEFLRLPHRKARTVALETDKGSVPLADLGRLGGKFPYIAFVPQWDFLDLVTGAARRLPGFRLLLNSEVTGVIREGGVARGVRYRAEHGAEQEIRAALTVGADGRHSDVRRAAGLRARDFGAPMDVVWFRLTRDPDDPEETFLRLSAGAMMVAINRETYWQLGYIIPKGGAEQLRAGGIDGLRSEVARLLPFTAGRVAALRSFDDVSVLSVALNRLRRWHRPGLLCVGDAAHAMSPVFGVGINLAVQDAVATANLVGPALRAGEVPEELLAKVQRRRTPPTVLTQFAQRVVQDRVIRPALRGGARPPALPGDISHLPVAGALLRRFIGYGVRPERVCFGATVQ